MRDFDAVFGQLCADAKAARDLVGRAAFAYQTPQSLVRDQRRCADRVSPFFIRSVVIARQHSCAAFRCRVSCSGLIVVNDRSQAVRLVAKENVRHFFHQRGSIALNSMPRIKNYDPPTVGQRLRAGAARPLIRALAEEMRA